MSALEAGLKEPTAPIWLIVGDAPLLVDRAVERIVEAIRPRVGVPAFNFGRFRAPEDGVAGLAAARTLPMMAPLRLVVITELGQGEDAFFTAVQEYAEAPSPSAVVVLAGRGFPAVRKGGTNWGSRIRNRVKKTGVVLGYKAGDVAPWRFAIEQARGLGHDLSRADAELLVELVGADLGTLAREVDKATLYVGPGEAVTADAIHAACSALAEAVVWDLTAALAARDEAAAVAALHRLIQDGDAPHRLLALVAWQLRSLLQASEMIAAGARDDEVRRATRMRWDVFKRVRPRLAAYPPPHAVLARLARANREMNSHRAGDRRIIEELVLDLCADPPRSAPDRVPAPVWVR